MMKVKNKTNSLNKKGFTLIELLAVISILAILMLLASSSVVSMIAGAKKNAFAIDAQNVVETAKLNYTEAVLSGSNVGENFCMSVAYLRSHGLEKGNKNLAGSINVKIVAGAVKYTVWLSDGSQRFIKVDSGDLKGDIVEMSGEPAPVDCAGEGTLLT